MSARTVKLQKYIDKEDKTWKVIEDPLTKIPEWRIHQLDLWIEKYTSISDLEYREKHLKLIEKEKNDSINSGNCLLVENEEGKQLIIRRNQIQE